MLTGKKTILRPIQREDLKYFSQWHNDPEIKILSLMHPFPVSFELEEEWYENISKKNDHSVFFSIDEEGELIGYTKLFNINWVHRYCYFGIVIGKESSRGKGIGTNVTKLMIDYAFNRLNLNKILLEVIDVNKNAIKLYRNLGFSEEGYLKRQVFYNGQWHDIFIMSYFH